MNNEVHSLDQRYRQSTSWMTGTRFPYILPKGYTPWDRLIEFGFYVLPDTKQVISETFFPANLLTKY